jgi:hypothetical protein
MEQEREKERKATEKSDKAFQERQVSAVEAANRIASRNILLTGIAAIISAFAFGGTLYQAHISRLNRETAQDTLTQIKNDALTSSQQFQVQLGHFDDGLGRTGLLAEHAGKQADAATKAADAAQIEMQAQASANRAILEIKPINVDVTSTKTRFNLDVSNSGPTQAINIHYVISQPRGITWQNGDHRTVIEESAKSKIFEGANPSSTGRIPDILGKFSNDETTITESTTDYRGMGSLDTGVYYDGLLFFDDIYRYRWERTFCFMVGGKNYVRTATRPVADVYVIADCNVSWEGLRNIGKSQQRKTR